jgi:2-desacetyl-2-hydroxyethyl bacteriochlorophyllide A dehydrogenase
VQALLYTDSHELEVRELDPPSPDAGEVIVQVEAAGICASDVDGVSSRSPRRAPPLIMGHELIGTVVASGGDAGQGLIGSRVAVNPQVTCGECRWCRSGAENICGHRGLIGGTRPGGFAERVAVPVRCLHPVSADTPREVAVLTEPLATCVHALSRLPDGFTGTAVVLGAGAIGMLAAQLLRASGTRRVIVSEPDGERRALMTSVADAAVQPADLEAVVMESTDGVGADVSVDAVGTAGSRPQSLEVLRPGGSALWLGMHAAAAAVPGFDLVVGERSVLGSFAYTNVEFEQALGLLESGLLKPALSVRSVPLGESDVVFRRLLDGVTDGVLKEIVGP